MERVIKFRGKSIINGEWVYGDLIQYSDGTVGIGVTAEYGAYNVFLVDERTVGQYVGIKDLNGNELYEGDILCFRLLNGALPAYYYEIYFDAGLMMFNTEKYDSHGIKVGKEISLATCVNDSYTLYGNIYDNPNLLNLNVWQ